MRVFVCLSCIYRLSSSEQLGKTSQLFIRKDAFGLLLNFLQATQEYCDAKKSTPILRSYSISPLFDLQGLILYLRARSNTPYAAA